MHARWILIAALGASLTVTGCLTEGGSGSADGGSRSGGGDPPGDGDGDGDFGNGDGDGDGTAGDGDGDGTTGDGDGDGTGGTTATLKCVADGCSSQLCVDEALGGVASTCEWLEEYACYQDAECAQQADGSCGWTPTPELSACLGGGGLTWWQTCGDPVCGIGGDDPAIDNCTDQKVGEPCGSQDDSCETLSCGTRLVCTNADPTDNGVSCPISRVHHKRDITYLESHERRALHDELISLPLASYHYKRSPDGPRELGFLIDDVEPSPAVNGERVNLYGYLSMAVAALQEQSAQISELRTELETLKAQRAQPAPICKP